MSNVLELKKMQSYDIYIVAYDEIFFTINKALKSHSDVVSTDIYFNTEEKHIVFKGTVLAKTKLQEDLSSELQSLLYDKLENLVYSVSVFPNSADEYFDDNSEKSELEKKLEKIEASLNNQENSRRKFRIVNPDKPKLSVIKDNVVPVR